MILQYPRPPSSLSSFSVCLFFFFLLQKSPSNPPSLQSSLAPSLPGRHSRASSTVTETCSTQSQKEQELVGGHVFLSCLEDLGP